MAKRYGYARTSTEDQPLDAQREALQTAKCDVVLEEQASGKSRDGRPKLALLLEVIGPGDEIVVCKLDRLSRSTVDVLEIVEEIGKKGAGFRSLAEPWCDTTSPAGQLMLTVFAGVAQFERRRMKERQREGIKIAKAKGVYRGGKVRFDPEAIRQRLAAGKRPSEIRSELGCSFDTITRAAKANGATAL